MRKESGTEPVEIKIPGERIIFSPEKIIEDEQGNVKITQGNGIKVAGSFSGKNLEVQLTPEGAVVAESGEKKVTLSSAGIKIEGKPGEELIISPGGEIEIKSPLQGVLKFAQGGVIIHGTMAGRVLEVKFTPKGITVTSPLLPKDGKIAVEEKGLRRQLFCPLNGF